MIRVGILGAGVGAQHLKGYRENADRFVVAAMCDLDTARASAALDGADDVRVVNDAAAVLHDPEIDLVDICLPPHLHAPIALQVLEAGKHAICEKPIARSLAEIDLLQKAIERTGRRIFPVFQYRYGLGLSQLRALQAAGLTGRALVASAETHWNRSADYYSVPWRGTWRGEAGGAVLSHAIHIHDLLRHVLGPVAELTAFADTRVNDIETEDCAALALRMASGALATSSVTLGAARDTTRLRFCFEHLTVESGSLPYAPAEDVWTFFARGATRQADVDRAVAEVAPPKPGFSGLLSAVADAIVGGDGAAVTFDDGRASIEFATAVYMSARERRSVTLPLDDSASLYAGWAL